MYVLGLSEHFGEIDAHSSGGPKILGSSILVADDSMGIMGVVDAEGEVVGRLWWGKNWLGGILYIKSRFSLLLMVQFMISHYFIKVFIDFIKKFCILRLLALSFIIMYLKILFRQFSDKGDNFIWEKFPSGEKGKRASF